MLILTGCTTTTASSGNDVKRVVCTSFEYFRWADADTDETIRQAKAHNAVMKVFDCPIPKAPPLNSLKPIGD